MAVIDSPGGIPGSVTPAILEGMHLSRGGAGWIMGQRMAVGQPGRPVISREVRTLIRRRCRENPGWGPPRVQGELLKLGIDIGESSVRKYVVRCHKPPPQTKL